MDYDYEHILEVVNLHYEEKRKAQEKLFNAGMQTARLYKTEGTAAAKTLVPVLSSAIGRINAAYEKTQARFVRAAHIPQACEWLLDNRYTAVREERSAHAALKAKTPLRSGKDGIVLLSACDALVQCADASLDEDKCRAFLEGYQSVTVLPQRELTLFPAVLRVALLTRLASLCDTLISSASPEALTDGMAAIFRSLHFLGALDLREFTESADVCERLLRADPAGVYPRMDAASRALYRERLSYLAEKNSMEEHRYARHLLSVAQRAEGEARHIGTGLFRGDVGTRKHAAAAYIAANVLLPLFLSVLCGFLSHSAAAALLLIIPVSELTKSLLDHVLLLCIRPRRLPRLEYKDGIPDSARTVCVISALITGRESAEKLCRRLEEFSLSHAGCGKNLLFGVLADLPEADTAVTEKDAELISAAVSAVKALNEKYGGGFYLFTRHRSEDRGRGKFCGFERKRGAVLALARLLCGRGTSLSVAVGDAEALRGTRYIITLDSDTTPTPGSLTELIGAMEHPLNKPVLDAERGVVTSGHGLIHPRMSYELSSVTATDFSRIFAGRGGIEPYAVLCGEVYMDLFDRGGFSGKGILDAEALCVCSEKHVPDGRILSHDALEGAYLRGGLMSDTEFTDSFPSTPVAYYRRSHRWTRGDWQNAGKILARGAELPDTERFRLFDSLRRSLVAPVTLAAIVLGLILPTHGLKTAAWAALISLTAGLLISLTDAGTMPCRVLRTKLHSRLMRGVGEAFLQTLLRLVLLPYEAWICLSAAVTALWRMLVSGKNLLEWETAAQSELKKRSLASYYLNMWSCAAVGAALTVLGASVAAKTVGVLWALAPLIALSLSFPPKAKRGLCDDDREYLLSCADGIKAYFERLCTAEDNYLPPDNYQEQPCVGAAHRTSPTNIGLALTSVLCAVKLGKTEKQQGMELISAMLTTLEKMPKYKGHFYNWYDTRTLRCLKPAYVSTVDSGNLYAGLIALKNGLAGMGETTLSRRAEGLAAAMDFSLLFDARRGLFRIGLDLEKNGPSLNHYDLLASESRLTSYLAVAKGDVPREHWRRLSRAMRPYRGYKGMASWTGTMFEYLMPELFLPLYPDSLLSETAKTFVFAQKQKRSHTGVWGTSESAFFSLDPSLSYRYKAHGCEGLALKRGQDAELVIAPYASFLALCVEPHAAVKNLRRLEKLGASGRFSFVEAIDYTPARCRSENGEYVRCFMAHHLGMSMLALTNCLTDGYIRQCFMAEPRMSACRGLLAERLPIDAPVLPLGDGGAEKPPRMLQSQWSKRSEGVDFEKPCCCVLSNGVYDMLLTESGICRSLYRDVLIAREPYTPVGDGHGFELALFEGEKSVSLLPVPGEETKYLWEFSEISYTCSCLVNGLELRSSAACAGGENGELRFAEIRALRELPDARLSFSFEPVLARAADYENHPAFFRFGIEAHADGNCLLIRRLARGEQPELWLCITCDRDAVFTAGDGDDRHPSYPMVKASCTFALKAGGRFAARFALCVGLSADEAYAGAQRMLAIGPSEYGMMPSACASLLSMSARETDAAMELARALRFPAPQQPIPPKESLWRYGISGDLPLIVCPDGETDPEACAKVTKQFCLLKSCGVNADLIILADDGGEYLRPVYSRVRDTLGLFGLESLLSAFGGVWILPKEASRDILPAALCTVGGSAPERVTGRTYKGRENAKRHKGAAPEYSYAADGSFVFLVNRSLPARVWSNILTNGSFGYLAADSGCGNMWAKNAREKRINRWMNDPHAVRGPETLEYIGGSGRCSVFADDDGIPCRVHFGFGTATWEKSFGAAGIRCTAFVPDGVDARVLIIELCGSVSGQLAWRTELQLGASADDRSGVELSYANSVFSAVNRRADMGELVFRAACSEPALGWTGELLSWERGDLDGKTAELAYPVFAAVYNCRPVTVIVCGTCGENELLSLCRPDTALAALEETKKTWRRRVGGLCIAGRDLLARYMSGWAVYQTVACRLMGRCSVYQSGGAVGFRDQLQDAVNMLLLSPELAKRQILSCCAHQYAEGDVMHWWHAHPSGDKGVRTRCSDDLLWLVWALCEYVEKTGDSALCFEKVCYISSAPLAETESDRYESPGSTGETGTVLEHAFRAADRCFLRGTGPHGLLLFGSGDWNDGMDKINGESVWLSWFFAHTVRRFADLLVLLCRREQDEYRRRAERIGRAADRAWDKTHYLRGYWPDGAPLGASSCRGCRIDSIAQSWAAFCAEASPDRIDMALDTAVAELYDRENGLVKLFAPPFADEERSPGYIESYGPGYRENGGQYTHAAIWLAMALLRRGRESDGFSVLCDLLPGGRDPARYAAEPFVLAADVSTAPGHVGEVGWSWYTGSAGWYFRVVTEELLGLKLWSGSLYIRPSLPEDHPGCTIKLRTPGGTAHEIKLRPGEILLDGEKYDGKGIPYR